ncbi:MAG: STAS domain-containing protein [Chloroflexi bacterium]|nr:STAS domain-containing protein [Chloroflexota bacterium]
MDVRTSRYHNVAILSVNGRLDALSTPLLTQTIQEQIAAGTIFLVADLQKVDYLSSAGIKTLLKGTQQVRRQGGDLRIASPRAQVKFVLHLAGVESVIKIYSHVVRATVSFLPGAVRGA